MTPRKRIQAYISHATIVLLAMAGGAALVHRIIPWYWPEWSAHVIAMLVVAVVQLAHHQVWPLLAANQDEDAQ